MLLCLQASFFLRRGVGGDYPGYNDSLPPPVDTVRAAWMRRNRALLTDVYMAQQRRGVDTLEMPMLLLLD